MCVCQARGFPLASFCQDDLYCAQCGEPIAWLTSPGNHLPDPLATTPGPAIYWVYKQSGPGQSPYFELPLRFESLDYNHRKRSRDLILSEAESSIRARSGTYEFRLEPVKEPSEQNGQDRCVAIRFSRDPAANLKFTDDWTTDPMQMPAIGIPCRLILEGNCGHQELDILALPEPVYEVRVRDPGGQWLQDDLPPWEENEEVEHAWAISKREVRELEIEVHLVRSFLRLTGEGRDSGEAREAGSLNPLMDDRDEHLPWSAISPADRIMGPGRRPCVLKVEVDARTWSIRVMQVFRLSFFGGDVWNCMKVLIHLYLEPRGEVAFVPALEYRIPLMHYGEMAWSKPVESRDLTAPHFLNLRISNSGEQTLELTKPRVEFEIQLARPVVEVDWASRQGGVVAIPPERWLDLVVKVDLSGLDEVSLPARSLLDAAIVVENTEGDRSWRLPLVFVAVRHREVLTTPLAIDFGNSNTYASYMRNQQTLSVLGGDDPEDFPTVIHFLGEPDAALSNIEIGRGAKSAGERTPSSMARQLKRWLLETRENWEEPRKFTPARGRPFSRTARELIAMFLEKAIRECENHLRSDVTQIGLTYPANLSLKARKRLDQVSERLKILREATYPRRKGTFRIEPIATFDSTPDEASAVALEFVHDGERFRNLIAPSLGKDRTFLVASYDFGGGSIDTALLRFTRIGPDESLLQFRSEHLSLGGDEVFGGDNVTLAVLQILLARFRETLAITAPGSDFPVDLSNSHPDGTDLSNNFQHLRVLADHLKRHLCQTHRIGAETPTQADPDSLAKLDIALSDFLGRHKLRASDPGLVADPPASLTELRDRFREQIVKITLDEVYRVPIRHDPFSSKHYTVDQRVRSTIEQLRGFVDRAGRQSFLGYDLQLMSAVNDPGEIPAEVKSQIIVAALGQAFHLRIFDPLGKRSVDTDERRLAKQSQAIEELKRLVEGLWPPHELTSRERDQIVAMVASLVGPPLFIVPAGAACRLPMVGDLLEKTFPGARIIDDPARSGTARPKSKVAFGLSRYLAYKATAPARIEKLSRAGHYTHGPIVWDSGGGETVEWVPTCSSLADRKWHPLPGVELALCLGHGRKIDVHHRAFELDRIGTFDLSRPPVEKASGSATPLPDAIDSSGPSEVLLQVNGSEDALLLRVHLGKDDAGQWKVFGDWEIELADKVVEASPRNPNRP